MLSFLNSVATTTNCKARATTDASRGSSTDETLAESTQQFCNGSTGAKKRRKGKQPVSTAKMASTSPANIANVCTGEIVGVSTGKITAGSTDKTANVSTASMAGVSTAKIPNISTAKIPGISATKIANISTSSIANVCTASIARATAVPVMANPMAKLQPIEIIIPQALDSSKKQDVLQIPSMDSPLFKDIPRKNEDSSSDSSSSSTSGVTTSDESSSSDDSDVEEEEEVEVRNTNSSGLIPNTELPYNNHNPQLRFKLTVSELGRPLKKDPSSLDEFSDNMNINSDANIDNKNGDMNSTLHADCVLNGDKRENSKETGVVSAGCFHGNLNQTSTVFKQVNRTAARDLESGHLPESPWTDRSSCVISVEEASKNFDLLQQHGLTLQKSDNLKFDPPFVKCLDPPIAVNDVCKIKDPKGDLSPVSSKQIWASCGGSVGAEIAHQTCANKKILNKDNKSELMPPSASVKPLLASAKSLSALVKPLPVSLKPLPASTNILLAPENVLSASTKLLPASLMPLPAAAKPLAVSPGTFTASAGLLPTSSGHLKASVLQQMAEKQFVITEHGGTVSQSICPVPLHSEVFMSSSIFNTRQSQLMAMGTFALEDSNPASNIDSSGAANSDDRSAPNLDSKCEPNLDNRVAANLNSCGDENSRGDPNLRRSVPNLNRSAPSLDNRFSLNLYNRGAPDPSTSSAPNLNITCDPNLSNINDPNINNRSSLNLHNRGAADPNNTDDANPNNRSAPNPESAAEVESSLDTNECTPEYKKTALKDSTQTASHLGENSLQTELNLNSSQNVRIPRQLVNKNGMSKNEKIGQEFPIEHVHFSDTKDMKKNIDNISCDNKDSEKYSLSGKMDKETQENKDALETVKQNGFQCNNLTMISNMSCNDVSSEKYLLGGKMDKETLGNKDALDTVKQNEFQCKDPIVSSKSMLSNNATTLLNDTAMTTTTSVLTTNSGSSMIPKSSKDIGGFTNGIPDCENPFITWTKFDDNDNSLTVNTSLPGSLVRMPFHHLALSGDASVSGISPLGMSMSHLSPVGLAASSRCGQLTGLSPGRQAAEETTTGGQERRFSPSEKTIRQQTSFPDLHDGSSCSSKSSQDQLGQKKTSLKSIKRTSRLSNIIDSLRTSKEKQAASSSQVSHEQNKKATLEMLSAAGRKSPSQESSSATGIRSSSSSSSSSPSSSSPVFSVSLSCDYRSSADKFVHEDFGYSHPMNAESHRMMRLSLDGSRTQADGGDNFGALKGDFDKGKQLLESLELMNKGLLESYNKTGITDSKRSQKLDNVHSHHRSQLSSTSSNVSSAQSSIFRLSTSSSSHLTSKPSSQASTLTSSSSLPSSIRANPTVITANKNLNCGTNIGMNSTVYQAAPPTALTAAHVDANTFAANILAYQHLYGMQDPYLVKTLMSNPLYLQRMMEFQKHSMDPIMLRQLEMYEILAGLEKSKNKDHVGLNSHPLLWQTHMATLLQQQHMQQLQQLQLQQLHQQAAAVREREARETITAIMANKGSNFSTQAKMSTGTISMGQSAKSLMTSSSTSSSSLSSSSTPAASKRTRPALPPSLANNNHSKEYPTTEKKLRLSHQTSPHLPNRTSTSSFTTNLSSSSSSSSLKPAQTVTKPAGGSGTRPQGNGTAPLTQSKQEFLDLLASFPASHGAPAQFCGFPAYLPPSNVDVTHMNSLLERASESQVASSVLGKPAAQDIAEVDVLDLSVKPGLGKA